LTFLSSEKDLFVFRPNLFSMHQSLLVRCLLLAGLPDALVEVATDTNCEGQQGEGEELKLAVKTTVLLGEVLRLSDCLLPPEVRKGSQCLPSLLDRVASRDQRL